MYVTDHRSISVVGIFPARSHDQARIVAVAVMLFLYLDAMQYCAGRVHISK